MLQKIRVYLSFLILLLAFNAYSELQPIRNFNTVSDFIENKFTYGTYHTEGFVVETYACPSCPEGAMCKPCSKDYIVIAEEKRPIPDLSLLEREIIIFVDDSKRFQIDRRYRFLVQVRDVKSTVQDMNNLKLIYSEKIK